MRRTGSPLPFRIHVASLWHLIFQACIFAPCGGPRGETSRPSGCRPTNASPYLRAQRFHIFFFFAFSPSDAQSSSPLALPLPPFAARALPPDKLQPLLLLRYESLPQRASEVPPASLHLVPVCNLRSSSSPVTVVDCELAASPATSVLSVLRRFRLASMSVCPLLFASQFLGR
jgi:hypothetical protein